MVSMSPKDAAGGPPRALPRGPICRKTPPKCALLRQTVIAVAPACALYLKRCPSSFTQIHG